MIAMSALFLPQLLHLPIITIQSGRRQALGWFIGSCWESRDGGILDEINLFPEHLGRNVFEIMSTLMHELIHVANHGAGIKDCFANNYHNEYFRDRAVSVGLVCERAGAFGWAKTRLSIALREWLAALSPDPTAFSVFRLPPSPRRIVGRWSCSGRCKPVWTPAGSSLHAKCLACGGSYFCC
jgi:hypothetical protein